MDDPLQMLMRVFREEASELLDRLSSALRSLREGTGDAASIAAEAMRVAHTIKGAAATVGQDEISALAHAIEDVLVRWRSEPGEALLPLVEPCDQGTTAMRALLEGRSAGDVAALAARIRGVASGRQPTEPEPAAVPVQASRDNAEAAMPAAVTGLRVDSAKLDTVMGQAGELVTTREEYQGLRRELDDLFDRASAMAAEAPADQVARWRGMLDAFERLLGLESRASMRLARATHGLGETVRELRLVRLDNAGPVWERAVAEAARQSGKRATLSVVASGIEIDKQLLDRLREPVIHLLRNAVDHGIEQPSDRRAAGKPAEGLVAIRASTSEGMLELEICDDGRGIDVQRVREAAVSQGRLDAASASGMTDQEVLALLFESGFSTAGAVTTLSGRGVGLDVVSRACEESRGRIEPQARGRLGGAAFRIIVPLDVLSTDVVIVLAGGAQHAIAAEVVERIVRVPASSIKTVGSLMALDLGEGEPLRVETLASQLGQGTSAKGRQELAIVVISSGARRIGLVVDEVIGAQEVVVKKLPWNLVRVDKVSGACVLPGGAVALVLDAERLVRSGRGSAIVREGQASSNRRILVVDDSHTARTLARTALVAAGWEVELASDGNEGWAALLKSEFGLVVSDIQMPGMDGFELARRIRADERLARLPIVLVTSRSTREDVERGLAVGANEYIVKGPLQQQQLVEAVARHL